MSAEFDPTTPVQLGSDEFRYRVMSMLGSQDPTALDILGRYADMDGFGAMPPAAQSPQTMAQQPDKKPQTTAPNIVSNSTPKPKQRPNPKREQPAADPAPDQPTDNRWRGGNRQKPVIPRPDIPTEPWNDPRAGCYTKDESFFEDKIWESAARALCKACVLRVPCLERELDMPTTQGIRGGLDYTQRTKVRQIRQNGLTDAQRAQYDAKREADREDRENQKNVDKGVNPDGKG
jgi:hypothetical protein